MKTARSLFAVLLALVSLFGFTSAKADGGVFYNGSHDWGVTTQVSGNAGFNFGSQNGGPAVFQGSVNTVNGNSAFSGVVNFGGGAFVPQGTFGSAQAVGFMSHSINANHFGGSAGVSQSFSSSLNATSSGSGSSNLFNNFNQGGNSNWTTSVFFGKGG